MIRNGNTSNEASRRDALGTLLWGSLLAVAAPGLYVAGRYLGAPRMAPASTIAGPESGIPPGGSRIVRVGSSDAIVMRGEAGLYALDLRCTHAGCNVRWHPDQRIFICPCHDGRFDSAGMVLKGPPTSPLVRLELRIEEGAVIVTDTPLSPSA